MIWFDKKILALHKEKTAANFDNYDYIFRYAHLQLLHNVNTFNEIKPFSDRLQILAIGVVIDSVYQELSNLNASITLTNLSKNLLSRCDIKQGDVVIHIDEEELELPHNKFDIIFYPYGLHWVNQPAILLANFYNLLKPGGALFANLPVHGSLHNLSKRLLEYESQNPGSNSYVKRISPFIKFEELPKLFTHLRFKDITTTCDTIELKFDSTYDAMKDIKNMGESACFSSSLPKKPLPRKALLSHKQFKDNINIANVTAFKGVKTS